MLVLTRKPQETIHIGNNITITVIKTKGQAVRIGIEAPSDVSILRGELANDLNSDNLPATAETETPAQQPQAPSQAEPDARFMRTSRSRVKTLLPQLLGDAGPLRELLDRRSEVLA